MNFRTRTLISAAAALAGAGSAAAQAETTLNALFMAQAAYSESDIRAMTADFTKRRIRTSSC